jgi:hypothetical protein
MPTLSNAQSQYYTLLRTLVHNPGFKFITQGDEQNALNMAALFVASKLGGILYIDSSVTTTAGVKDYILPNHIAQIRYLELVDTSQTPEVVTPVDVVSYELMGVIQPSNPALGVGNASPFAYFIPEQHRLHIDAAPQQTGIVIRALCYGLPNVFDLRNQAALYDGNVEQVYAIVHEAASIVSKKMKELAMAKEFHQYALEGIEAAAEMNGKRRQVSRVQVYRHTPQTRLRRV